ncbi:MAG: glycosyltransferase family 4 protein [Gemmatimonadetes bacterium]|nr:glycosyltransferase family 4 protein [Gemmatimonadota bacterium]
MKVLFLTPFSPVPADFGGALRVFHILRQLARRHEVTVLGYGEPQHAAQLRREIPEVHNVRFLSHPWLARNRRVGQLLSTFSRHSFFQLSVVASGMQRAIDDALEREPFDVVHTEFSHMGPFELKTRALRVLDAHNVEYDNFRRMWETTKAPLRKGHYLLEYLKMRHDELALSRSQDALLATSERDAEIFGRDVPGVPRHVIPNGVDTAYFTPSADEAEEEPHSLVFTGMMAYVPNYDGIGWFLDEVLPLIESRVPGVKLYVVGKNPPESITSRATERVVVTGTVPDVRPFVHRSSVYIVPLRMGGGTRLKIAEALSMRKPIVTTRIGCEGIDLVDGESALLADSAPAFANAVVRLLGDAALRTRLAGAGEALAKSHYEWSVIGDRLEEVYRSLARTSGERHQRAR